VELKVSDAAVENSVSFSPQTVEFTAVSGDPAPPQYTALSSDVGAIDEFSIASVAEGGWLTAELLASPRGFVKISVNTSAAPGLYSGAVKATSLRTGTEATATVNFRLQARTLAVTPPTLAFRQSERGAAVAPQELQVTSNRVTAFRVVTQPEWVTIEAPAGLTTPARLVVSVRADTLPPGQYEGSIRLNGPVDLVVPVSLVLPEPAPPTVTPAAIAFSYDLGGAAPAPQSVTVLNPTGTARFAAQALTVSGIDWLEADPASGSTPGTIALKVKTSRLTPGEHSGTLSVAVESTPAKVITVPVTLTVRGSAVQVHSVLGAATLQPSPLSPGLLLTLTGLGLGPETPVSARPSAAGSFDTQLAGVQVQFDGVAAPLLLVSSEQINAIVPYSVHGRTSARIQAQVGQNYSIPIEVKVVDAAPGIFTQGQTGRGQAVAFNADFAVNSVLNPARRGSVVTIYMTGEGQTDPPGQNGRVITTDLRKPLLPVTATIGGKPAEVLYVGSAPQSVSGICQVNLRIPEDLGAGAQAVEILVGGTPTQRGVTVEIQ
jgi:uncharacterized protein (TIGR03437 family)